jgi:hypothetical protein
VSYFPVFSGLKLLHGLVKRLSAKCAGRRMQARAQAPTRDVYLYIFELYRKQWTAWTD